MAGGELIDQSFYPQPLRTGMRTAAHRRKQLFFFLLVVHIHGLAEEGDRLLCRFACQRGRTQQGGQFVQARELRQDADMAMRKVANRGIDVGGLHGVCLVVCQGMPPL